MIATLLLTLIVLDQAARDPAQGSAPDSTHAVMAGRPLAEALRWLESRGLKVIFSTDLVRPDMRVKDEPKASRPRQALEEILAPHGLAVRAGPRGTLLVVAGPRPRAVPKAVTESTPASEQAARSPRPSTADSAAPPPRFKETVVVPSDAAADAPHAPIAVSAAQVGVTAGGLENIFHTLQLLPGVTATSDFGSRLSVRGGGPDQNLIVMDGFEIHNPYRLFGLVSGINPETVSRFELFAGPFSARYGDRLSSLLVIDTRDGSATRTIQGSANVSLTDANVVLEGRLPGNQRGSWLITGRRTYYDLILEHAIKDVKDFPGFTDTQLKTVWEPWPGQKVTVHGLFSREGTDISSFDDSNTRRTEADTKAFARTKTTLVAATWDSAFGVRAHLRTNVSLSRLKDSLGINANGCIDTRRSNAREDALPCFTALSMGHDLHVRDLTLREDVNLPVGSRQALDAGVDVHGLRSRLNVASAGEDFPALSLPGLGVLSVGRLPWHDETGPFSATMSGARVGLWIEDRIQASSSLTVVPGLRVDHVRLGCPNPRDPAPSELAQCTPSAGETLFAPRIASSLSVGRGNRLTASAGVHYQSPGYDKAFLGGTAFAVDLSAPQAAGLRSERAVQAVVGVEHDFAGGLTVRLEGYRRQFDRLIVGRLETEAERQARVGRYDFPAALQKEIPQAPLITRIPSNESTGQASGLELFVSRKTMSPETRLTGWLSYSYGSAEREAYGIRYPFDYDRRHALSLVGQYNARPWLILSGSAQAASGLPATVPVGARVSRAEDFFDLDEDGNHLEWIPFRNDSPGAPLVYELDFGRMDNVNATRLPGTIRVDARATFHPHGAAGRWQFYLDVINVTNRRNKLASFSSLEFDPAGARPRVDNVYGGGFPIVPTFGIKWRF